MGDALNPVQGHDIRDTHNVDIVPIESIAHVHRFVMDIGDKRTVTYEMVNLLKSWITGKGAVTFVEMSMKAVCKSAGANLIWGFCPAGSSVTNVWDAMSWPNSIAVTSNAFNVNTVQFNTLKIPEGYTDLIWPTSGTKPPPGFFMCNSGEGHIAVTIELTVKASGPFVYRYQLGWQNGGTVPMTQAADELPLARNVFKPLEGMDRTIGLRVPMPNESFTTFRFQYNGESRFSLNTDTGVDRHVIVYDLDGEEEWTYSVVFGDEYKPDMLKLVCSDESALSGKVKFFYSL